MALERVKGVVSVVSSVCFVLQSRTVSGKEQGLCFIRVNPSRFLCNFLFIELTNTQLFFFSVFFSFFQQDLESNAGHFFPKRQISVQFARNSLVWGVTQKTGEEKVKINNVTTSRSKLESTWNAFCWALALWHSRP